MDNPIVIRRLQLDLRCAARLPSPEAAVAAFTRWGKECSLQTIFFQVSQMGIFRLYWHHAWPAPDKEAVLSIGQSVRLGHESGIVVSLGDGECAVRFESGEIVEHINPGLLVPD